MTHDGNGRQIEVSRRRTTEERPDQGRCELASEVRKV